MDVFIGADIGTTGIRAGVYDEEFNLLGTGSGRSNVKRGAGGEIIQDADEIYTETAAAVNEAVRNAAVDPSNVACLSFDGQMAGVMGIDENWNAVTPYDSWLDTRCAEQVSRVSGQAHDLVVGDSCRGHFRRHGAAVVLIAEVETHLGIGRGVHGCH